MEGYILYLHDDLKKGSIATESILELILSKKYEEILEYYNSNYEIVRETRTDFLSTLHDIYRINKENLKNTIKYLIKNTPDSIFFDYDYFILIVFLTEKDIDMFKYLLNLSIDLCNYDENDMYEEIYYLLIDEDFEIGDERITMLEYMKDIFIINKTIKAKNNGLTNI